jgi:hypothetical protein
VLTPSSIETQQGDLPYRSRAVNTRESICGAE